MRRNIAAIVAGVLLAIMLYGAVGMLSAPQIQVATNVEKTITVTTLKNTPAAKAEATEAEQRKEKETTTTVEMVIQVSNYYTAALVVMFSLMLASTVYIITRRKVYG